MIKNVEALRKKYPEGVRIKLGYMDDQWGVPSGTEGTVRIVDDAGNIHVNWDNGSRLALIPEVDKFWRI